MLANYMKSYTPHQLLITAFFDTNNTWSEFLWNPVSLPQEISADHVKISSSSKVHSKIQVFNFHFRVLVVGCENCENLDLAKIPTIWYIWGRPQPNWVALRQGLGTMTHGSHYHFSENFRTWLSLYQIMLIKLDKRSALWSESLLGRYFPAFWNVTPPLLHNIDMYANNT